MKDFCKKRINLYAVLVILVAMMTCVGCKQKINSTREPAVPTGTMTAAQGTDKPASTGAVTWPDELTGIDGKAVDGITPVNTDELYGDYATRISNGLTEFCRIININRDFDSVSVLSIECRSVFGISSEGAQLTRFMTSENNIVRYTFDIFGETGKSIHNYYYFSDGLVYIQLLIMDYADWNFSTDNRFDILRYSLNSYVVDGTKTYMIDDAFKQVIEVEEIRLNSLNELNQFFNDDN